MLIELDNFYLKQEEPIKSCLLALREIVLKHDKRISASWKYGMPFFCIDGKMVCYIWVHKRYNQPYLGIVEGMNIDHPDLLQEKRARMKILLVDKAKDLPVRKINSILKKVVALYNVQNELD